MMLGSRLVNGDNFECTSLVGLKVEEMIAFHEEGNADNIVTILAKFQGKSLWQRLFLDIGFGFWEEYDKESAFEDFEGDPYFNWGEMYSLIGEAVKSIACVGSYCVLSQMFFKIGDVELNLGFKDSDDWESDVILTNL